jgi:carboxymethylenebutenolidase
VALAIDLYRGKVAASADEAHELMRGLPEGRAARDLKAAVAYLRTLPSVRKEKVGAIGWCMGGGYSLMAATEVKGLAASAVCYGRLVSEPAEIKSIGAPLLGIFGGADRGIPVESVKSFEAAARKAGKQVEMRIYPEAGHAFMNPNNSSGYREADATDAWARIHAFFALRLGGSVEPR